MISFQTMFGQTPSHSAGISASCVSAICPCSDVSSVGASLQDDIDREERIKYHRDRMESCMKGFEETGCFTYRGEADYHRIQFEREIKERSAAQVAKMERELGLA